MQPRPTICRVGVLFAVRGLLLLLAGSVLLACAPGNEQSRPASAPPTATVPVPPGGLEASLQQALLDASWGHLKPNHAETPLVVGLTGVADTAAAALAAPRNAHTIFVYLQQQGTGWEVVLATTIPSAEALRDLGIPEALWEADEHSTVMDTAMAHLHATQEPASDTYITWPRIVGDVARLTFVPGAATNRPPETAFFARDGAAWRLLTSGLAFSDAQLRDLGIPEELWAGGALVHGPEDQGQGP